MSFKYFINPNYAHLEHNIKSIPQDFNNLGTVLKNDRNELRVAEINGVELVIKSFKRHTIANRFIYKFFRKSKARRSYENAQKLLELGICTPTPIAYIEEYNALYLKNSYFISCFTKHEKVDSYLKSNQNIPFLEQLGEFLFLLHEKKIFHYDLHISNILVIKDNTSKFRFCLVDINRLKFKNPTKHRRIKNLNRLCLPFDQYSVLISKYAEMAKVNVFSFAYKQLYQRKKHHFFRQIKNIFKDLYKKIKP